METCVILGMPSVAERDMYFQMAQRSGSWISRQEHLFHFRTTTFQIFYFSRISRDDAMGMFGGCDIAKLTITPNCTFDWPTLQYLVARVRKRLDDSFRQAQEDATFLKIANEVETEQKWRSHNRYRDDGSVHP